MRHLDLWSSGFWFAVSAYVCLNSVALGLGTIYNPGPGFLFFWSGVAVAVFSAIVFLQALSGKGASSSEVQKGTFEGVNWYKIVGIMLSLVAYGLILERAGFLIATFLLVGFLLRSIEAKKWTVVISIACASALVSYTIFELWLRTRLPRGFLGI